MPKPNREIPKMVRAAVRAREVEAKVPPADIDEYVSGFPRAVQAILEKIRKTIRKAAPGAEETISYRIPTFTLDGKYVVYLAAHQKHIGLYPVPTGNAAFEGDLSAYAAGKGTARFPLDEPIPFDLISKIVKFRVRENAAEAAAKESGKKRATSARGVQ